MQNKSVAFGQLFLSRLAAVVVASSITVCSFAQVTFSSGTLSIITGSSEEDFRVVVGPANGRVTLFGVPGVSDGTFFTGVTKIDIKTNAGYDKVHIETFAAVLPNIVIDTGTGHSEVRMDVRAPAVTSRVVSRLTLKGNSADDKFFGHIQSLARHLRLIWNINARGGTNEAYALVESEYPTSSLDLRMDYQALSGDDKLIVESLSSAPNVSYSINASMGDGRDEIVTKGLSLQPANMQSYLNLNMGEGEWNKAIAEYKNVNGTLTLGGQISGGTGGDTFEVKAETNVDTSLILNGDAGHDIFLFEVKQGLWGSPQLLGGAGNDHISMLVEGPRMGSPFVDGGSGYDTFVGWATTVINVEEISWN